MNNLLNSSKGNESNKKFNIYSSNIKNSFLYFPKIGEKINLNNNLYKRKLVYSDNNDYLYKSLLINLEISSTFSLELKKFIANFIDEHIDKLQKYSKEELNKHKNDLLSGNVKRSDIDIYVVSFYLKRNFIILNDKFSVIKILGNYITNKNKFFYFIADNKSHIESLYNKDNIKSDKQITNKIENILKYLIYLKENNKEIYIEECEKIIDLKQSIPELHKSNLIYF